ncbi:MAG: BatA domain-containing protein, partial [Brucellaceae bacterium]|nr:BatA domain-containing protein [Brucellaceae bacterium]
MPLIFTAPWLLAGLATLPVIWWLLRATPPKPAQEPFPPLAILAKIARHDQEASKSPWWLTALRLLLAALVIFAVAGPVWKPQPITFTGAQPVVIMIDNGWSSAPQWAEFQNQAQWLIGNAEKNDAPVFLIATADPQGSESGPFNAAQAKERLQAMEPRPVPVDRLAAAQRLNTALANHPESRIFYLNDGLATAQDKQAFAALDKAQSSAVQLIMPEAQALYALQGAANQQNALVVNLLRPVRDNQAATVQVSAYDNQGRMLAQAPAGFAQGSATANAQIAVPVELRNDAALIRVDTMRHAAATWLLDENNRRRRVALLDAGSADKAHSLLSPLHYISSAMAPFADLISANDRDLGQSVKHLLEQKPSVIVLSDIGRLPEEATANLLTWVQNGGTLLRFAGPRLAAAQGDAGDKRDPLLPVQLRSGQRSFGGTLSWSTPQAIAPAPEDSPFRNIQLPDDVTVSRQVLAEPAPDLMQKSWLNLADGTPLITGENRG